MQRHAAVLARFREHVHVPLLPEHPREIPPRGRDVHAIVKLQQRQQPQRRARRRIVRAALSRDARIASTAIPRLRHRELEPLDDEAVLRQHVMLVPDRRRRREPHVVHASPARTRNVIRTRTVAVTPTRTVALVLLNVRRRPPPGLPPLRAPRVRLSHRADDGGDVGDADEASVVLRDEHERRRDAHEPPSERVREPVALVQREQRRAVKRAVCASRGRRQVMHAGEVPSVPRLVLRGADAGAELGHVPDFDAVRDDDLRASTRDAAEVDDALEDFLDEPRGRVRPGEGESGGGVGNDRS
eukprot:30655-Pelagococcus_subviridis.AAC.15